MPRLVDKKMKTAAIGGAAIKVFRRLGYHKARMADIAAEAGIGKGTLYEYFDNKADILRFEIERYFSAFESGAAEAMARVETPGQRLMSLVGFAFDHAAQWEDHCAVYVEYFGAARDSEAGHFSLFRIYAKMQGVIRALLEQGIDGGEISSAVDPVSTAELLVSVFDGVVLHGVFAGKGCGTEAMRKAAFRLISGGLLGGGR
ncbi:MAG: TetR/AcrR family transcriptional regulator [Pseudomonadota bacterium]